MYIWNCQPITFLIPLLLLTLRTANECSHFAQIGWINALGNARRWSVLYVLCVSSKMFFFPFFVLLTELHKQIINLWNYFVCRERHLHIDIAFNSNWIRCAISSLISKDAVLRFSFAGHKQRATLVHCQFSTQFFVRFRTPSSVVCTFGSATDILLWWFQCLKI